MTYEEFIAFGKDKLPSDIFSEVMTRVLQITLGAELVIAGFSDSSFCLMETSDIGETKIREDFAVAGSGSALAQTALLQRGYTPALPLSEAIYCIYEAKRYAENVPGVGKATLLMLAHPDGRTQVVMEPGIDLLKEQFGKFGPQPLPRGMHLELTGALREMPNPNRPHPQ